MLKAENGCAATSSVKGAHSWQPGVIMQQQEQNAPAERNVKQVVKAIGRR
jgi:hypothetical protein